MKAADHARVERPLVGEHTTVDAIVRHWAERHPERPLLRIAGSTLSAAELSSRSGALAAWLAARGIGPADRIAVCGQNSFAWVVWLVAAAWRGAAVVAVHPGSQPGEFSQSLTQAQATWLVVDETVRGRDLGALAQRLSGLSPDSPCPSPIVPGLRGLTLLRGEEGSPVFDAGVDWQACAPQPLSTPQAALALVFTSGSSGRPKLVQLSHRAIVLNAWRTAEGAGIGAEDRIASPLPLYHAGGLSSGLVLSLVTGALWSSQPRFAAQDLLAMIDADCSTVVQGVPTMFKALMVEAAKRPLHKRSLRLGFAGAAHVSPALTRAAMQTLGLRHMCVVYGQSEFGPTITLNPDHGDDESAEGHVGEPIAGTELRIADPATGAPCEPGQAGEIQVRGLTLMDGYLDDDAATRAAIDGAGWLHTGDLGTLNQGRLRILGRLKNLIIRGGENISAGEIEDVLLDEPGVADACVVPVPSEHWGEVVCAVVQPAPGAQPDAATLQDRVAGRLARYKRPEHVLFWNALPLLPSGKVDRRQVRDKACAELTTTHHPGHHAE